MPKFHSTNKPSSNDPYYVGDKSKGTGLLSKIKGFFTAGKSADNEEPSQGPENVRSTAKLIRKKPYDFNARVDISNIDLSVNESNFSLTESYLHKNPNDTLSEFFNKKGNEPLNDIEIEGVLSLIKKSTSSRVASRNNSVFNNSGMFNNMNANSQIFNGSKITGLTSFNDSLNTNAGNTTILRHASDNLKEPVKIATPTYTAKKNGVVSGSVSTRNSSINMNSITLNRSLNNSSIRKKRIVDYSGLRNAGTKKASPLSVFMERRKREETELLNKEKKENVENTRNTKNTNDIVYNGGIIDLSCLANDEEDGSKKKEHVKKVEISNTATQLLDILNAEEEKEKEEIKEKEAAKSVEKDNTIDPNVTLEDAKKETDKAKTDTELKPAKKTQSIDQIKFNFQSKPSAIRSPQKDTPFTGKNMESIDKAKTIEKPVSFGTPFAFGEPPSFDMKNKTSVPVVSQTSQDGSCEIKALFKTSVPASSGFKSALLKPEPELEPESRPGPGPGPSSEPASESPSLNKPSKPTNTPLDFSFSSIAPASAQTSPQKQSKKTDPAITPNPVEHIEKFVFPEIESPVKPLTNGSVKSPAFAVETSKKSDSSFEQFQFPAIEPIKPQEQAYLDTHVTESEQFNAVSN